MQYVGKVISTVSDFYRDLNPATLSGAVDIIVVKDKEGELRCSPFHVRFGKLQLLRPSDKTASFINYSVEIIVNDQKADFYMKLGESGEAFFVLETDGDIPSDVETSPIISPSLYSTDFEVPEYYDLREQKLTDSAVPQDADSLKTIESIRADIEKIKSFKLDQSNTTTSQQLENINRKFIDDTQIPDKHRRLRRPLSIASDSQFEISAVEEALSSMADSRHEGLHDEWDWGLAISNPIENKKLIRKSSEPTLKKSNIDDSKDTNREQLESSKEKLKESEEPETLSQCKIDLEYILGEKETKISNCGSAALLASKSKEERLNIFESMIIPEEQILKNPASVFNDKNAILYINGNYYLWENVSTLMFCWIITKKFPEIAKITPLIIDNPLEQNGISESKKSSSIKNLSGTGSEILETTPNLPEAESRWRWWGSRTNTENSQIQNKNIEDKDVSQQLSASQASLPEPVKRVDTNFSLSARSRHYAKTLRMTSGQLASLNLKLGENKVRFRIKSGKGYVEARIFLYNHDVQIVISDIDGTITKSDALGHLFNMVGRDWTHTGVAKLFTEINRNQYEFLYLTSRAIGQADTTREYLKNIKQDDYKLPSGPLILSPDRLFASFHREIIMKKPQEFKMACLRDIKNLFDNDTPFYAGFGNRITDAMSYRSVNVPVSRICTIDPTGDIKLELLLSYKSSYPKMGDLVDLMFPPLKAKLDSSFNDFAFWRSSLPEIEDELALLEVPEQTKTSLEPTASIKKRATVMDIPSKNVRSSSFLPQSVEYSRSRRAYSMINENYDDHQTDNPFPNLVQVQEMENMNRQRNVGSGIEQSSGHSLEAVDSILQLSQYSANTDMSIHQANIPIGSPKSAVDSISWVEAVPTQNNTSFVNKGTKTDVNMVGIIEGLDSGNKNMIEDNKEFGKTAFGEGNTTDENILLARKLQRVGSNKSKLSLDEKSHGTDVKDTDIEEINDEDYYEDGETDDDAMSSFSGQIDLNEFPYL
ncbi:hypothetical protein BB559_002945 [Furculomyces boomerangus]|uniref:phosphatidate phosphatase n=1 Tax=Furculomyces boomerangus TaxID=61424 RepID=A0A2T9YQK9_9FUNG|nr:hypothetical protein BB559_002945 [Furculomyces boomerangus]